MINRPLKNEYQRFENDVNDIEVYENTGRFWSYIYKNAFSFSILKPSFIFYIRRSSQQLLNLLHLLSELFPGGLASERKLHLMHLSDLSWYPRENAERYLWLRRPTCSPFALDKTILSTWNKSSQNFRNLTSTVAFLPVVVLVLRSSSFRLVGLLVIYVVTKKSSPVWSVS